MITAALGHDAIMPCQLNLSDNVKMVIPPVLYWAVLPQESDDNKLWPPSENYKERVDLLDKDLYSPNKSVLFRNVLWADSGRYQCKVSITTKAGRFRRLGNTSLLVVHGKYNILDVHFQCIGTAVFNSRQVKVWLELETELFCQEESEGGGSQILWADLGSLLAQLSATSLCNTLWLQSSQNY